MYTYTIYIILLPLDDLEGEGNLGAAPTEA